MLPIHTNLDSPIIILQPGYVSTTNKKYDKHVYTTPAAVVLSISSLLVFPPNWSPTPTEISKIRTVSALTPGIKPRYLGGCDCDAQQMGYAKTHPSRSPKNIVGWRGKGRDSPDAFFGEYVCTPSKNQPLEPKDMEVWKIIFAFEIGWFLRFHVNFSGVYIIHHTHQKKQF